MKKVSSMETTTTAAAVGIDVGDRFSHWCALHAAGDVMGRGRVRTTPDAIATQAEAWRGARVAIENGTHSGWISRALSAAGCLTTVANPSRWRGTAHASKNDRNDAEALARVVRVDPRLLFPIEHRSQTHQQDLTVIRSRAQLVKTRTQLVNTARSLVKSLGARLPRTDAAAFHAKTWNHVPPPLRPALAPLYRILAALSQQIHSLDHCIDQLSQQRYPLTARLRSCPASDRSPPSRTCTPWPTPTASPAAAMPARIWACVPNTPERGTRSTAGHRQKRRPLPALPAGRVRPPRAQPRARLGLKAVGTAPGHRRQRSQTPRPGGRSPQAGRAPAQALGQRRHLPPLPPCCPRGNRGR